MQDFEHTWPAEARAALQAAQKETAEAGCGGCPHSEWVSIAPSFMKERDFHLASCRAGMQLGTNRAGLFSAVTYCTARNKSADGMPFGARDASHVQVVPTLRPSPSGRQ